VTITQARMMFVGVIVLLVSRIASAQSQSNTQDLGNVRGVQFAAAAAYPASNYQR